MHSSKQATYCLGYEQHKACIKTIFAMQMDMCKWDPPLCLTSSFVWLQLTVHCLRTDVEWQHIIADSAYLFVLLSFMPAILRPSIVACTRQSQPACHGPLSHPVFLLIYSSISKHQFTLIHDSVLHQAPCMIYNISMHLAHHQSSQVPYLYASATPSCCARWESSQLDKETDQKMHWLAWHPPSLYFKGLRPKNTKLHAVS